MTIPSRDYLQTDRFRRYTELILWDPKGNKRIFGNAPVKTVREAHEEGKRLGLAGFEVRKMMQFEIEFQNFGKLPAKDVRLTAYWLYDGQEKSLGQNSFDELPGGAFFHGKAVLWFAVDYEIPAEMRFVTKINYSSEGEPQAIKTMHLKYISSTNNWSWEK